MGWLRDRIKGAINHGAEALIWAGLVVAVFFIWRRLRTDVTIDAWLLTLALGFPAAVVLRCCTAAGDGAASGAWSMSFRTKSILARRIPATSTTSSTRFRRIFAGVVPNVTSATFIEQGILQPARDFLMQGPGEDVRVSLLVPENGNWKMALAAGYRLESRQRFSLPIVGSFSRHGV